MRRLDIRGILRGLGAAVVTAMAVAVCPPEAFAQTTPPAQTAPAKPTQATTPASAPLPVNVDKIRRDLKKPQPLHLEDSHLQFYLEVHPPPVSFMSLVGSYDLMKGAVPGATITGRDIDRMVTPREMYGSAGITATDLLQFAATNYAAQSLIRRAAEEIRQAKSQNEVDAIRARIDRELEALKKGGSDKN